MGKEPDIVAMDAGQSRAVTETVADPLPFVVELWKEDVTAVEAILARVQTASLAHAVFSASCADFPARLLTLRHGEKIVRDTAA